MSQKNSFFQDTLEMILEVVYQKWIYTADIMLMVLLSILERRLIFIRDFKLGIESSIVTINEEICKKIRTGVKDGYCIGFGGRDKMFDSFPRDTDPDANLYLIGYTSRFRAIPIHFEDIPKLDKKFYYFLMDTDISVYRKFLESGLSCWIHTGKIGTYLTKTDILEMSKILRQCQAFLETLGNTEIRTKDLVIRIHKGTPSEVYINHRQIGEVTKTVFREKNDLLESLKLQFAEFMETIPLQMPASVFCDMYVNSVINFLHEMNLLRLVPSIGEYPELIHYLFPFIIRPKEYKTREEELITGGVALDRMLESEYLKPLFNTEEVLKKTKSGGRFIFAAHASFGNTQGRGQYEVDFL